MNDKLDVKTAIKDTFPTVFGYIGIGLAFGIIASSVEKILSLLEQCHYLFMQEELNLLQ